MKILVVLFVALLLITAISGCTAPGQQRINSPEQATQTVKNVSHDISDVEDTITDIEQSI